MELEESMVLTSDYMTKLQSSIQYGNGTKAEIYNGEKTVSSISGAEKNVQLHVKE